MEQQGSVAERQQEFSRSDASPHREPGVHHGLKSDSFLGEDIAFLLRFGIGYPALIAAQRRAEQFAILPSQALIDSGAISERDYFCCVAFELGLEFANPSSTDELHIQDIPDPWVLHRMARMVAVSSFDRTELRDFAPRKFFIAPDCSRLEKIRELLVQSPELTERITITTFSGNRRRLINRCQPALLAAATGKLARLYPKLSARRVITVAQSVSLLLLLQFLAVLSLMATGLVPLLLHLLSSLFYLGCVGLRLFALFHFDLKNRAIQDSAHTLNQSHMRDAQLPFYSVLVALYREEGQVEDLVDALLNLDWPPERLEIFLICEADDQPTLVAIREKLSRVNAAHISLISVPVEVPRTKPKALNYALPLCRGEFVAIFDAEDRPSPMQLREACAAFRTGPDRLACVQAPLVIFNHHEGLLARLFAIEYSALFDGLLPALAKFETPLPLGGTSNHFKREVLIEIGGWDPYNVTEDADIGIRLARAGCLIATITRPTFEEAPVDPDVWLKQRTRWFKGWYQTWLVHNRHPITLFQDLGFKGWLVFQLMITGMAVSALVHPFLLYFILNHVTTMLTQGGWVVISNPLILLDVATILLGYLTFAALAWNTLPVRGLAGLRSSLWAVPLYWMLLSAAAWRALWHLLRRPHEWEKTPHRLKLGL